ncbi:serine/threonine protein kinase [Vibrio ponticus]|uniref:Serine/threonine protein kinase n=1 Tax=Vibrio ponticus TaxID=265668 RepID=A0ABX3FRV6_9VIBR|nr:serine/threonine-protein kinase [Vibrio ponticus]OLQ95774.1 serine/threonine protein kinase [Vibrio ponticus]
MNIETSSTNIYYSLLDLEESHKQARLSALQKENPSLYAKVKRLVNAESSQRLTQLFHINVSSTTKHQVDHSNQQIDKYLIESEIGRGGLGVVYAATRADKSFEQRLAVKLLHSDLANILPQQALFAEAQLLARLNHPHIAKVFDGGIYDEQVYLVMERIEGDHLAHYLESHNLSERNKLMLFGQICAAIEHSHQQNIVHGDLKPENILIDHQQQTKLIDFNLTQNINQQQDGFRAFSRQYASPEQQAGERLSPSSDIYSLGKLLEWLLLETKINHDLQAVINKATKLLAEERYQSVAQLQHDIECVLTRQPISLRRSQPVYQALRLFQRHPLTCSLALFLTFSATLFSSILVAKNQQLQQEKRIAENMMFEVTSMMFNTKSQQLHDIPASAMLDLTRRRILANPEIPAHIKQKMLLAMMTSSSTPYSLALENNP